MSTFVFSENKTILGKKTDIAVDKKSGSRNIRRNNKTYFVSIGYFEKEPADKKHTVYIIGNSVSKDRFRGIVICILKRKDDGELLFVACEEKKEFFEPEIRECLKFFERKHESDYEFLMSETCQMIMFKYINGEKKYLLIENSLTKKACFPQKSVSFDESEEDAANKAMENIAGLTGNIFEGFRTEYREYDGSVRYKKTVSYLSEYKSSIRNRTEDEIDNCFSLNYEETLKRLDDPQDMIALMEAEEFYEQKAKGKAFV